jgi:hypothetical protein
VARRIAVLGWGSLLWEGGDKFDAWHTPWRYDGPLLTLEFSRISRSRRGALTLVIDPQNGTPTIVAYCLSLRTSMAEAIDDLRMREATKDAHIGRVQRNEIAHGRDPASLDAIRSWADGLGMDGVIWTDLPSNFVQKTGRAFSVDAARAYVLTLDADGQAKAREYARSAPAFLHTPVRDLLVNL